MSAREVILSTSLTRDLSNHTFQCVVNFGETPCIFVNCSLFRLRDIIDSDEVLRRAAETLSTTDLARYIVPSRAVWTIDLDKLNEEFGKSFPAAWSWLTGKAYVVPTITRRPEPSSPGIIRYKLHLKISEESKTMKPTQSQYTPPAITESLTRFRADHPDPMRTAFIMMKFGETAVHSKLLEAIKETLSRHGITGVRADDKQYDDDLYPNIQTYMHGCGIGIVVFERLQSDAFNPNVAFEAGYMMAMQKPVLLLKDKTLQRLHTDLIAKLFKEFDPQDVAQTVQSPLESWLKDKGLLDNSSPAPPAAPAPDRVDARIEKMESLLRSVQFVNLSTLVSSNSKHDLIDRDEHPHAEIREITADDVLVKMRTFPLGVIQLGLAEKYIVKNREAVGGQLLRIPWDFVETVVRDSEHEKTAMMHLTRRIVYDVSAGKWRVG